MSISAVVITRDEVRNIVPCLESVRFCDEVIVLDSGSRDGTREAARPLADRVEIADFENFASQKNRAADLARGDWILSIDADERVTPDLTREIRNATARNEDGFTVPRLQNFFGTWLRHGGFYPDRQLRLYRRGRGQWERPVHERVNVRGCVGHLTSPLLHYPYATLEEWVEAINRHTTLGAQRIAATGAAPSLRRAFTTAALQFVQRLLVERAYLDGGPGVIASGVVAFEGFLVHAKHWVAHAGVPRAADSEVPRHAG